MLKKNQKKRRKRNNKKLESGNPLKKTEKNLKSLNSKDDIKIIDDEKGKNDC